MSFRVRRRFEYGEAVLALIIARLMLSLLPFRPIAAYLGTESRESVAPISDADSMRAREVRFLIRRVSQRLGWHSKCLVKSVAAIALLRQRGLIATCYLGVARAGESNLRAHAWVRCGHIFVVGGRDRKRFTEIGRFTKAR